MVSSGGSREGSGNNPGNLLLANDECRLGELSLSGSGRALFLYARNEPVALVERELEDRFSSGSICPLDGRERKMVGTQEKSPHISAGTLLKKIASVGVFEVGLEVFRNPALERQNRSCCRLPSYRGYSVPGLTLNG